MFISGNITMSAKEAFLLEVFRSLSWQPEQVLAVLSQGGPVDLREERAFYEALQEMRRGNV